MTAKRSIPTTCRPGRPVVVLMATPAVSTSPIFRNVVRGLRSKIGAMCMMPDCNDWVAPREYRAESGQDLRHNVFVGERPLQISGLVRLKLYSLDLERQACLRGYRRININPGLLLHSGLLVASHKPKNGIRIPLGDGVWGQWVLSCSRGRVRPTHHSFSEYSCSERVKGFERILRLFEGPDCTIGSTSVSAPSSWLSMLFATGSWTESCSRPRSDPGRATTSTPRRLATASSRSIETS